MTARPPTTRSDRDPWTQTYTFLPFERPTLAAKALVSAWKSLLVVVRWHNVVMASALALMSLLGLLKDSF